jgi:WD40 repeat protein/predicted Ser/Thr protein kinase
MTEDSLDPVENLFHQAADLPAPQQQAFLDAACADNPALRVAVENLLADDARLRAGAGPAHVLKSPLLRMPAGTFAGAVEPAAQPWGLPLRVGHYCILRRIAEGGMGAVYEAEQDSPRRTVALKVVRPGLASPALIKRFTHEAQILGRLHHRGIAQVYEAGLGDDGQPFFAMEFIRGLPLDEYARIQSLTVPARVELVARVCDAVQHAHEKGVIHRDLKPANILVDESGQPRVLDFGVARATDADLITGEGLTRTGQLLGTPEYMSPEQVIADPAAIDQRADVYALGIILFELAADRRPYQLENRPLAEAARLILEEDPPRLGSINPELQGDIETIVAKALEKDRGRRYASAADLAADLRHWLAHEPIRARPPSALYHLRKFARRHKALVVGAITTGVALVLGLIGTILFAVGESRQRNQAEQNARAANDEKQEALFQAYRARVAAASAALQNQDVADAARQLDAAPQELRDWEWQHLHTRLDDSSAVVPLRAGDSALLLSTSEGLRVGLFTDGRLRVRDASGNESGDRPYPNLARRWLSVARRATGWLLAATNPGVVTVRDETGRLMGTIRPRGEAENQVALSPDGKRLAALLYGNRSVAAIYDIASGQEEASYVGESGLIALAFSPDSRRLAVGGDGCVVHICDAATGKQIIQCRGHTSKILSITFRRDGLRLLTSSHDGTVRQWDAQTGYEVEPSYDRHRAEVSAAIYSPDGERVASAGADRTVRLWQASGRHDQAVLRGHTGTVSQLAFSEDGRHLVSASYNLPDLPGDGTVRFWEAAPDATLPLLAGHTSYVYPVAYSPDGRWIASGSWDNTVRLWDAATGEACATLPHASLVRALAFTPDSTRLVSAGGEPGGVVHVWDLSTGRIQRRMAYGKGVTFLTIAPDGTRIAVGTYDQKAEWKVAISDFKTGKEIGAADGIPYAFSPDGALLAGVDADMKDVILWDARTCRPVTRWQGHTQSVNSMAFDRDGSRLVSASKDSTVRLWDVASGRCLQIFKGHTDQVFAAAVHPDGTRLATAGRDRAIWLWDLARGEEVVRLQGHTSYVWSLTFSPDGTTLASGSGDFTVRLWDTSPLKVRYQARRKAEALRPEAERLVEQLWRQKKNPDEVVESLRADPALSEPLRQAALRALLRASPPEAARSNPHGPR